jgi:hypothetical protein
MAIISKPKTFAGNTVAVSSDVNSNFDTIYNEFNGQISNVNIAANAGIVDTKLAPLTTANKTSGSSFFNLSSIPSGAGTIPAANLPTAASADVTDLGNLNGTQALSADGLYKAVLTGNSIVTLPTPTSGKLYNIMFQFTMGSVYTLTVPGTVTWNYSVTPTYVITKVNRIIFDTIDGGTTWNAYYSQF